MVNIMKIGYYVHSHGDGHRQRAIAIAKHYPHIFTLIGTNLENRTEGLDYLDLPSDSCTDDNYTNNHLHLTHYTPYNEPNIRHRMRQISDWIDDNKPDLMVVDVSVEIAMLARILTIPTVYVRLVGKRSDSAHMDAFLAAEALLCPFAKELETETTDEQIRKKSYYFADLSSKTNVEIKAEDNNILVLLGAGGHDFKLKHLIKLAKALPKWKINVLGPIKRSFFKRIPKNLHLHGWIKDYLPYLTKASIVIGSAGDGVVSNVLNLKKPYICVPQYRPFDEQIEKAKKLSEIGIDVIYDLNSVNWKEIIHSTSKKNNLINKINDNLTTKDAANLLIHIAGKKNEH